MHWNVSSLRKTTRVADDGTQDIKVNRVDNKLVCLVQVRSRLHEYSKSSKKRLPAQPSLRSLCPLFFYLSLLYSVGYCYDKGPFLHFNVGRLYVYVLFDVILTRMLLPS